MATGNLGTSFASGRPVSDLVGPTLNNSLVLATLILLIVVPVSIWLGLVAARHPGGRFDRMLMAISLTTAAVPMFTIGALLALLVGVQLQLLPALSLLDPSRSPLAQPGALVLPVATAVLAGVGRLVRFTRAGAIDALQSEHVEAARLRGVDERTVIRRHALPSLLPVVIAVTATSVADLVTGLVVIEVVFEYPGVGTLLQSSVGAQDVPTVQAIAMIAAALVAGANLFADVSTRLLVPRLRTGSVAQ
jgi:peptide/nickel transport system permease protein